MLFHGRVETECFPQNLFPFPQKMTKNLPLRVDVGFQFLDGFREGRVLLHLLLNLLDGIEPVE